MSLTVIAVAASLFAVEPTDSGPDESSWAGLPRIELYEYKVHVKQGGRWTVRCEMIYDFTKMNEEDIEEFMKGIQEAPAESTGLLENFFQSHRFEPLEEKRWRFLSQGKSNDMLLLAALIRDLT